MVVPNKNHLRGKPSEMQSIYFWLCDHINDDGNCFPSRTKIAKEAGCGIRTVDKYLKQLVDEGFVEITLRKKSGTQENMSSLYQVMLLNALPSVKKNTTPSVKKDIVTVPIINSTHLTTSPPKVEVDNKFIFKVSYLWKELVSKYLETPEKEVFVKNIFFTIKALYLREQFNYDDFKGLFNYFLEDKGVKRTDKMSFNLAMSGTYVSKYKIFKKSKDKPISNAQIAESMRL